jgi:hypothetical protein
MVRSLFQSLNSIHPLIFASHTPKSVRQKRRTKTVAMAETVEMQKVMESLVQNTYLVPGGHQMRSGESERYPIMMSVSRI